MDILPSYQFKGAITIMTKTAKAQVATVVDGRESNPYLDFQRIVFTFHILRLNPTFGSLKQKEICIGFHDRSKPHNFVILLIILSVTQSRNTSNRRDRWAGETAYQRVGRNQSTNSRFVRSHLPVSRGTYTEFALETSVFIGRPREGRCTMTPVSKMTTVSN